MWSEQLGVEHLEARQLLAGDLIGHWSADVVEVSPEGAIDSWTDTEKGVTAAVSGTPTVIADRFGGRSMMQFDPSDGNDSFRIVRADHFLPTSDFSVSIAFSTEQLQAGGEGAWFESVGLVDANRLGFDTGWGVSMRPDGDISVGLGNGFGSPSVTIESQNANLIDGELHTVVFTRTGSTVSVYIDQQLAVETQAAPTSPRLVGDITFGTLQQGSLPFAGEIGDIRFFDGALDSAEVSTLHGEIIAYYSNSPPVAVDDSYSLNEDTPLTLVSADQGVLANDTDADGDPLSVEIVEESMHGTISLSDNGSFIYAVEKDFFGTDSFTYVARDFRNSNVATVTLQIANSYDPAIAVSDSYKLLPTDTLNVNSVLGVLTNDINPDRAALRAVLQDEVSNGSLSLNDDGSFVYQPNGFAGLAQFTYQIDDGTQLLPSARVNLIVNTPPATQADAYSVAEDVALQVSAESGLLSNDVDAENDRLRVQLVTAPAHGELMLAADGSFLFEPEANYFGRDRFEYRVMDDIDPSTVTTVDLDITAVNDAPTALADVYFGPADERLNVDAARGLLANDFDIENSSLSVQLQSPPSQGTVDLDADGSFSYQPNAGFSGIDSLTYTVTDGDQVSEAGEVQFYVGSSPVRINEFMAANVSSLVTKVRTSPDGNFPRTEISPDWLELHNITDGSIDLGGFYLSDDPDRPKKWQIPNGVSIGPNGFELFFASGRDITDRALDEAGYLHTNFGLNIGGDYLSLAFPDGRVADELEGTQQFPETAFGRSGTDLAFLDAPTPGAENSPALIGATAEVEFSVARGFYSEPFVVQLTTETPAAEIRFTVDGSEPSPTNGFVYSEPLQVETTTIIRAAAYRSGFVSATSVAQSYFFLNDVINQPELPEGLPDEWANVAASYGMDPDVVGESNLFNDLYRNTIIDDLKSLPTVSLAFNSDDIFGSRGIYQRPTSSGDDWERTTSVEFMDPHGAEPGFQINSGIRIMGGSSRQPDIPKHSFRLEFREQYGVGELDYPLFEDQPFGADAMTSFDELVIRVGFNNSWMHRHYYQGLRGEQPRDQWVRDMQLAMGNPAARGRYIHLYLNGMYWGIYNLHERPAAPFMADYFGGNADTDWDVISSGDAIDGTTTAWRALAREVRNADTLAGYEAFKQKVDVVSLADYMLLNFYVGNTDWDGHNWISAAKIGEPFRFFAWDSEFAISLPPSNAAIGEDAERQIINVNRTAQNSSGNPSALHQGLARSDEYKLLVADRVQKFFFNDGVFSPEVSTALFLARSAQIDRAVVAESARWGDFRRDVNPGRWRSDQFDLFTRDEHYVNQKEFIVERYLPVRAAIVVDQLRRRGMYPEFAAPVFNQLGGRVESGFQLAMDAPDGTIYYTLDGSDPRVPGGAISPGAMTYDQPIALTENVKAKARVWLNEEWSALSEADFQAATPASEANLRITEVHYHPSEPTKAELDAGWNDEDDFEFIELLNISDGPIDLSQVAFVRESIDDSNQGIDFSFAASEVNQLDSGQRLVVVENLDAFQQRYGSDALVAGVWSGRLSNSSEQISLVAGDETIAKFTYQDDWYPSTDGAGNSLVAASPNSADTSLWNEQSGWRASVVLNGTPGQAERLPGDVNNDGLFNSADLVIVFEAAEFEDGVDGNSTFEEGDWDDDGDFTSRDLVLVFQLDLFEKPPQSLPHLNEIAAARDHDRWFSDLTESDERWDDPWGDELDAF